VTSQYPPIRRFVTGHDAVKVAKVIMQGAATNAKHPSAGTVSTLIWSTDRTPADIAIGEGVEDLGVVHDALSVSVGVGGDAGEFAVDGDLTIRGTTKPVVVDVELIGIAADPRAGQRVGFDAKLSFDRTQWGLTWNMPVPSGVLVGEKITIDASIAATPKAAAIAA